MSDQPFKKTIPTNGIAKNSSRRFSVKRVPRPSPYVEFGLRQQYAAETMRSLNAPAEAQIIELELMCQEDEDA